MSSGFSGPSGSHRVASRQAVNACRRPDKLIHDEVGSSVATQTRLLQLGLICCNLSSFSGKQGHLRQNKLIRRPMTSSRAKQACLARFKLIHSKVDSSRPKQGHPRQNELIWQKTTLSGAARAHLLQLVLIGAGQVDQSTAAISLRRPPRVLGNLPRVFFEWQCGLPQSHEFLDVGTILGARQAILSRPGSTSFRPVDDIGGSFLVFIQSWPEVCAMCPRVALWWR